MSKLVHCLECDWKGKEQELIDKTTLNGGDECVCPNCGSFEGIEYNSKEGRGMTYSEKLDNYILNQHYTERNHLHWMRDCLRKILLNGVYYPGNIYSDIRDYIKAESELNEIQ